ncbi:MAG: DNA polymerase Y family protein, partial [Acidimicrobiaceae bacterium]|nr:DNA polymerase Y family protein [Acidimicrobiaceae bacterium]
MAREPSLPQPQAPPERMVAVRLGASHADDWEPVAAALEQFTPLAEALRPGLHAFGARGPSRYFGGERALAELVAKAVALPSASRAGVGVADGLFAAGLAAEAAAASTDVLVIPPQQSQPFLDDLPLISLRDPVSPLHGDEDGAEALLDVLWRLGMRTLGDLAALSEADMLGRFGWPGLLAHRLACGLDDRPLQAEAAGDSASVEAEIDPPADRVETVAFTARAL